jgi:hypothetical protein
VYQLHKPSQDAVLCCSLQAYLMFGDRQYLDMFIELYAATMKHMKVGLGCVGRAHTYPSAFIP